MVSIPPQAFRNPSLGKTLNTNALLSHVGHTGHMEADTSSTCSPLCMFCSWPLGTQSPGKCLSAQFLTRRECCLITSVRNMVVVRDGQRQLYWEWGTQGGEDRGSVESGNTKAETQLNPRGTGSKRASLRSDTGTVGVHCGQNIDFPGVSDFLRLWKRREVGKAAVWSGGPTPGLWARLTQWI